MCACVYMCLCMLVGECVHVCACILEDLFPGDDVIYHNAGPLGVGVGGSPSSLNMSVPPDGRTHLCCWGEESDEVED